MTYRTIDFTTKGMHQLGVNPAPGPYSLGMIRVPGGGGGNGRSTRNAEYMFRIGPFSVVSISNIKWDGRILGHDIRF